jgi:RNA polymerase sigma-70 factor (sigma-E family)
MMRVEMEAVRIEGGRLAELYRLHIDEAFRLAYLLTGNRELAEDMAHDAFVRLAGRLLHLRQPGDFSAYLRRTVVNVTMSQFRRRRVEQRYLRRAATIRHPEPTEPDVATRDQMRLALLRLPARQRTAIVLRFYEDLSDSQTAEFMSCRPGTVRSLVARGMQTLRPLIRGAHDG